MTAFVLLGACAISPAVFAQDEVTLSVVTGAGGAIREHAAAPVFVQVTNQGPAIDVWVIAELTTDAGGVSSQQALRTLSLPQNSVKRVTLYVDVDTWSAKSVVTVREVSGSNPARGRVVAQFSEPVRVLTSDEQIQGVIDGPIGGLLTATRSDGEPYTRQLYFSSGMLPPDAVGWEMCDSVVLMPGAVSSLSRAELRALRDWTATGGDLIVVAAELSPVYGAPEMRSMLPIVPEAQRQGVLTPFDAELLYTIGRAQGGRTLLASSGMPLVTQRDFGLGTATVFAFDISTRAFQAYRGHEGLWRRVLPEAFAEYEEKQFGYQQDAHSAASTEIIDSVTRTPEVGVQLFVIVLLIALYAAAIGPGDYILVRRLQRPLLTWITFPSIVLVFVSVTFLGASIWVGGDQEVHAIRSTIIFPEDRVSIENEALGFFAAGTRTYRFSDPNGGLLRDVRTTFDTPDPVWQDQDAGERMQRIPTWSARSYSKTAVETASPAVEFSLTFNPNGFPETLEITNNHADPITDLELFHGSRAWLRNVNWRGTMIGPGETVSLAFERAVTVQEGNARFARNALEHWVHEATVVPRYRALDVRPIIGLRREAIRYRIETSQTSTGIALDGNKLEADSLTDFVTIVRGFRGPATGLEEAPQ